MGVVVHELGIEYLKDAPLKVNILQLLFSILHTGKGTIRKGAFDLVEGFLEAVHLDPPKKAGLLNIKHHVMV